MIKKEYCFFCDKDVQIKKEIEKKEYKINGEKFLVDDKIYKCKNCDNEIIPDGYDPLKNIYDNYLKHYGLDFDDFKKIRKSLNLSQELFSKLLGWSKKTIARYETLASFPQKEYLDTYKRLKASKSEIVKILNDNKERLKEDYYTILKQTKLEGHIKTINAFLYVLQDNALGETQLMKNMFALDFHSNKTLGSPITTLKYAKAPFGPIIDKHEKIINYLVNNDYLSLVFIGNDKVKFKSNKDFNNDVFSDDELSILEFIKNKLKNKSANELSEWSHEFVGWQNTKIGQIIDYKKYKDEFNFNI